MLPALAQAQPFLGPLLHFSRGSHPPSSCLSKLTLTSTFQLGLRCHPHLPPPRSRWPSKVPARSLPLHAPNPHACAALKPLPPPSALPKHAPFPQTLPGTFHPLFPSILGTLFPSHQDKHKPALDLPAAALLTPSAPPPMLARRGVPQQSLPGLPSPARTQPPRRRSAQPGPRPPRPSLPPPPSPLSAPTHTPPLPGNFPHQFKGIQPIHPSTPFSNKQSNEQTHTASQKPKQKPPHLNLSAGTPLTALPQSPPARPGPQHSLQLSLPLCSGTTHKPLPAALAHSHTNPSGLLS